MTVTYEGKTASELTITGRMIYSDRTGKMRRLRRSPHTGKPIVEELNEVYGYFATVAFPSLTWAEKHGLT